jgi:hypothetical protein
MNIVTIDREDTPPFTQKVEFLLGGLPRAIYEDNTRQFVSFGANPKFYSPRLNLIDLEEFCKKNINHYLNFRSQHELDIVMGLELPEIEQFWLKKAP